MDDSLDEVIPLKSKRKLANLFRAEPLLNQNKELQDKITTLIKEILQEGKQVYENVIRNEGIYQPQKQNMLNYGISAIQGGINLVKNFPKMKVSDKYKHAMMNCNASQYGQGGADIAKLASDLREWNDIRTGSNTVDNSQGDNYANLIGRLLGSKYPNGNCNELIQKYIKKNL